MPFSPATTHTARNGHVRLQLRPHVERTRAIGRINHERPIDVELAVQDVEDFVACRQHADDGAWRAVDGDRTSHDGRIALEDAPPETVAQDHDVVSPRLRLVVREAATARYVDADHPEE